MSLIISQDFTLYRLRSAYLNRIHDGVGERLIHLDAGILNEPAFRATGWTPDHAAIKRCYSPPIPCSGAAEYFSLPKVRRSSELDGVAATPDENGRTNVGRSALAEKEKTGGMQSTKVEEDLSSDASEESDEEEVGKLGSDKVGIPETKITSPSYRPRTSSLGAAEHMHAANAQIPFRGGRPRRDTATSSEMSSENEGAVPDFRRRLPLRPQLSALQAEKITEEPGDESAVDYEDEDEDVEVAEASDLSDEFEGDDIAVPSPQLPIEGGTGVSDESKDLVIVPPAITPEDTKDSAPKGLPKLPKLPQGRVLPKPPAVSLLSVAFKDKGEGNSSKPFQKYAGLSGQGEPQPLWIKIHAPFSDVAQEPIQVPLRRTKDAEGGVPTVEELIGLALFRFDQEGFEFTLKSGKVESWELRMVEDGDIDMDFPALSRHRPVTDFTSNNNRPPNRRMRDKPWDEFGLVHASGESDEVQSQQPTPRPASTTQTPPVAPSMAPNRNPITGPFFPLKQAVQKSSALDAPQAIEATSTPRMGAAKTVTVHFTDPQSFKIQRIMLETTADTYIAELFDMACARLRLDKALYLFKVRGTQTVAPSDRTVEALGSKLHLDLSRRRFGAVGDFGLGLSGSPGSSSPNAPLELVPNAPFGRDGKRRKGFGNVAGGILHPLTQPRGEMNATNPSLLELTGPGNEIGRRYNVLRKQPLSFAGSHPRTLIISPEMMQVLPAADDHPARAQGGHAPSGAVGRKVTYVPMNSIIGVKVSRKHPKMIRVLVYRERETKRYDFECSSHAEAETIVGDIKVGLGEYGVGGDD
ncbi:hypothetical protein K470DRAFT_35896 [Piedraia hortae CBS 480.64]|uniref:SIN1-domain-containing protein n=1 Tax=Piedraia hortae CBS 480.64 TaxID=1314780 RepID=A0A6A7C3Z5_9PEZI|nr:hypothetical protein K470DRAFT_35896 [Piedraia hortae CBS 480.64]